MRISVIEKNTRQVEFACVVKNNAVWERFREELLLVVNQQVTEKSQQKLLRLFIERTGYARRKYRWDVNKPIWRGLVKCVEPFGRSKQSFTPTYRAIVVRLVTLVEQALETHEPLWLDYGAKVAPKLTKRQRLKRQIHLQEIRQVKGDTESKIITERLAHEADKATE